MWGDMFVARGDATADTSSDTRCLMQTSARQSRSVWPHARDFFETTDPGTTFDRLHRHHLRSLDLERGSSLPGSLR